MSRPPAAAEIGNQATPCPPSGAEPLCPAPPCPAPSRNESPESGWLGFAVRSVATAFFVGGYYWMREPLDRLVVGWYANTFGGSLDPARPRVIGVLLLLAVLVAVWRKLVLGDPRFQAPLLVTTILAVGDAAFNILENHPAPPWLVSLTGGTVLEYSPTFVAIVTTIVAELILGRFFWGKWPHLASAYISGISVGILIKSSVVWPFVACGLISIASKYVLRAGNRHIWNPSNFGVTAMLFLAPSYVASLSVQAGNNGWAVVAIWVLGGMIMYRMGRFHIPLAFTLAFVPLAFLRSYYTGHAWQTELAPITSPMFQLYIFFMITDPKTTVRGWWRQVAVAVLVAMMETFMRLAFKDIHSLYHALFIVGPVTNLIEITADQRRATRATRPSSPPPPVGKAADPA
jgi:enediyne biosynthesis protein E5